MSEPAPLTIANGLLVLSEGEPRKGAIRCEGGKIVALGDAGVQDGQPVIDAKGALIAPGLVDFGVFAIDKPAFHFGGITRAALMPDQSPVLDHPARVRFAAQSGKPDLWVHPLAAATKGLEGRDLAELALMREAGAKAVSTGRRLDRQFGRHAAAAALCGDAGPGGGQPCRGRRPDRQCRRHGGRNGDPARSAFRPRRGRGAGRGA